MVADKGYHSDRVLLGLEEAGQAAHIPEPRRAERDFEGKPETERVVQGNRERVASPAGKRLPNPRWISPQMCAIFVCQKCTIFVCH